MNLGRANCWSLHQHLSLSSFISLLFSFLDKKITLGSNKGGGSKSASWAGTGGGVAMTDGQKQSVQQLEQRDADFDRQLDEIGEGIQDLAEIAALQGEEVKRQSVMLESVNNKMDKVNERMTNVNSKMKETLEEVGRAGDKMCVDIMCVVLAVGFGALIYNFTQN
jgi:peptidoglycan hydrolase CwlO-like protein